MLPNWTNHLKDPEEKKRFISYVKNSKGLIDRLNDILKEKELSLINLELGPEVYDSPSWAAQQADINGQRRMLRWIQTLLTLDQKETTNG